MNKLSMPYGKLRFVWANDVKCESKGGGNLPPPFEGVRQV